MLNYNNMLSRRRTDFSKADPYFTGTALTLSAGPRSYTKRRRSTDEFISDAVNRNQIFWIVGNVFNVKFMSFITALTNLDFIHLLVSPRRIAAEEKARFGDHFSKSRWIKSS